MMTNLMNLMSFLKKQVLYLNFGRFIILCILVSVLGLLIFQNQHTNWVPQSEIFDGVEMVLVPVGCFRMGRSHTDIDFLADQYPPDMTFFRNQTPQTDFCFDEPFWIDKYLVTNAQFRQFNGLAANESYWDGDNRPRETITWFEAQDFCKLRGGRLPTEAEWEYAARGPTNLVFPWGNDWNPDNAVWSPYMGYEYPTDTNRQTRDVGSKPSGASWVGALDMAGNLRQWTASLYRPYVYDKNDGRENMESDERRVVRGGSWAAHDYYLQSSYRFSAHPDAAYNEIGFRCVRLFG